MNERRISILGAIAARRATALACASALLLGCATVPEAVAPETTAPTTPSSPGFLPRSVALPDDDPRPAALRLLEANRFSLTVQDADLRAILLGLARDADFNAVIEPGVTGQVTADFKDLSLRQILEQILAPRGLHYGVRGNVLRVFRAERATRIYRVDYPNYERNGTSDFTISGAIASNPQSIGEGSAGSGDSSSAGVQTTQVLDFWDELEASLRGIVFGSPAGEGGDDAEAGEGEDAEGGVDLRPDRNVIVSRHSGLVTVTAEQDLLNEIEEYLYRLAQATQRQVLIDVKILEIDIGDDMSLGIDWEVAAGALDIGGSRATGTIARGIGGPGLDAAAIAQNLAPALTTGGFFFGLAADDISAAISAIAEQRDVRVVSTPRLATLNNHKALIKVVRNEVFFVAEVETQILQQVAAETTTQFVPQVIPVGVTLDLTPQISERGDITMHIHPSISEIVDVVIQPSGDPSIDSVGSLPVIDLRETDTVMRVQDGQTILIGGLIQSRELERQRKVPVLGEIPLLGQVFRNTEVEESRSELVILVTPSLLDAPMVTRVREDAEEALAQLGSLREERQHGAQWWRRPFGRSYAEDGMK